MLATTSPTWTTRLRDVFGAALADIRREHLERLVEAHVREDADLDFKATLYGGGDSEKRDLAGDIAAMRNTRGGVIVLGVEERDGAAVGLSEVQLGEDEELRMRRIVADLTAPHADFDILPVHGETGSGFYLLLASPSSYRPHAVIVNKALRYPRRDGANTRYLSEAEVADMYRDRFRGERQQLDRLEDVTTELLAMVEKEDDTPWLVGALVPNSAGAMQITFTGRNEIEQWARTEHGSGDRIDGFYEQAPPVAGVGVDRYTIGTVYEQGGSRPTHVYAECHTDGAATAGVVVYSRSRDEETTVTVFNTDLVLRTARVLRLIGRHAVHNAGAYGEATVELRLVGQNMALGFYRDGIAERYRNPLVIQEARSRHTLTLEAIAGDPQQLFAAVKVMLGQIFNAFGHAEIPHIADDGTLRLRYFGDDPQLVAWAEARGVATSMDTVEE